MDSYDADKIVDCMFDPTTSSLIAELEDGEKTEEHLAKKMNLSEKEIQNKLDYLIKSGFIIFHKENISYSANSEKLTKFIEENNNFDSAVDGLTKMDSYLN